jgi:hypothetical protein
LSLAVRGLSGWDITFLLWKIAVGVLLGAVVARRPELREGAVPPLLWLLIGMGLFEVASVLWRDRPDPTNILRIAGFVAAFAVYSVASSVLS